MEKIVYLGVDILIKNKDICDEIHDEYIDENKIVNEFNKDNEKKMDEYLHSE